MHNPNGEVARTPSTYVVLVVQTKKHLGDDAYVLDLTGIEVGQPEAVVPFQAFGDQANQFLTDIHPRGDGKKVENSTGDGIKGFTDGCDLRNRPIQHEVHQCMLAAVKQRERDTKTTIQQLVRSGSKAYEEGKMPLLDKISSDMKAYVEKWEKQGCPLRPIPRLSQSEEELVMDEDDECTVSTQGGGSRAYQRYKADREKRPEVEEMTLPDGKPIKFYRNMT